MLELRDCYKATINTINHILAKAQQYSIYKANFIYVSILPPPYMELHVATVHAILPSLPRKEMINYIYRLAK